MVDDKPCKLDFGDHIADTHLAEARDQNSGNGISGHYQKNKPDNESCLAILMS